MTECYYRFHETTYDNDIRVCCEAIPVIRETPATVILNYYGQEKRCFKNGLRSFAHSTVAEALRQYRIRRSHQARWLRYRLDVANETHDIAARMIDGTEPLPSIRPLARDWEIHTPLKRAKS